jgi:hypothetical protein
MRCLIHGRRAAGADLSAEYLDIARRRIELTVEGNLSRRPLGKLVYVPNSNDKITKRPKEFGFSANGRDHDHTWSLFA